MSKLKRAAVASVFALGVTAAMITPASAAGTATYSCPGYGTITGTFTRINATTVDLNATIGYSSPSPLAPGAIVATLGGSAPYPRTMSNPNVLPPTGSSVLLRGTGFPASLPAPPNTITLVITLPPPPTPPNTVTVVCTRTATGVTWPV